MNRQSKLILLLAAVAGLYLLARSNRGQTMTGDIIEKIARVILGHEGEKLDVYQDEAGIWTVGKGHKVLSTDIVRGQKLHPFGPLKTITQAESDAFFERDTASARNVVANKVNRPLTDNMRAALVSLAFNIGNGAFSESTLLKRLNAGDVRGAADQFLVWNKITVNGVRKVSNGLVSRRARERELFLS